MRWIKDSIHGDIFVSDLVGRLIDTPEMQRLRRVGQTAFCNIIYPGANHTRFEHSLGTYYLTNRGALFLGMGKDEMEQLGIAGLLHDVGHSCFSHALEPILERETGMGHEGHTEAIISRGGIADTLDDVGMPADMLIELYKGTHGKLISGDIGTDRMDYLLRDSLYTGVAYGAVDKDRILRKLQFIDDKLVLDEKALSAAEAMLLARFLMFPSVYAHPVPKTAEIMLQRAVERAIENRLINAEDLVRWDDWQLISRLRDAGGFVGETTNKILNRQLFKPAAQRPLKEFENWLFLGSLDEAARREVESEIAERAGVDPENIILQTPKAWFSDIGITVLRHGDLYSISEVSLISRVLKEAQWDYCQVTLLCPEEMKEKVSGVGLSPLEDL